MAFLISLNSQ